MVKLQLLLEDIMNVKDSLFDVVLILDCPVPPMRRLKGVTHHNLYYALIMNLAHLCKNSTF